MTLQPSPTIALIGCGIWGRNIARNLAALHALAGVSDTDPVAAANFAKTFNVPVMSFDAVLAADHIKGTAIVTSAPSHAALAIAALNAGKVVYIEKPLALNVSDAEKIADANNTAVMVGHLIRHHAAFQRLLSLVQTGAIGDIKHIRTTRIAAGRIRNTESVLFDLCPHDLALIAALTGQETPDRVQCHGICHVTAGIEDSISAQLNFPSGITASIEANWLNPQKIHTLTVIGTSGALVFDDALDWPKKLTQFEFAVSNKDGRIDLTHNQGVAITVAAAEPLKDEMQNFIAAANGTCPPLTDITEALYVQRIMARMQACLT